MWIRYKLLTMVNETKYFFDLSQLASETTWSTRLNNFPELMDEP